MYAIFITYDGRGGRFHQEQGSTLVAYNDKEINYLKGIINSDYTSGELVELGANWPYDVICVHEIVPSTRSVALAA